MPCPPSRRRRRRRGPARRTRRTNPSDYRIEAIGSTERIEESIDASEPIRIYRQYVDAYGLGYEQTRAEQLDMPAFGGSVGVKVARSQ